MEISTRRIQHLCFFSTAAHIPTSGCNDPLSQKFPNSKAIVNDGSCLYENLKLKSEFLIKLRTYKRNFGLICLQWFVMDTMMIKDNNSMDWHFRKKFEEELCWIKVINHDWEKIHYLYIMTFGSTIAEIETGFGIIFKKSKRNHF